MPMKHRAGFACDCKSQRQRYHRPSRVVPPRADRTGMSPMVALHNIEPNGPNADWLNYAREIIRAESAVLRLAAARLDERFLQAVDLFHRCPGRVAITGAGKSADVGHKIAGTLNSTGTRAYFLDATKAMHGDLGMVHPNDVALVLSHRGE